MLGSQTYCTYIKSGVSGRGENYYEGRIAKFFTTEIISPLFIPGIFFNYESLFTRDMRTNGKRIGAL
jgi:hypothetical protein